MNYFMIALAMFSFGGSVVYYIQGNIVLGTMVLAWVIADICVIILGT